MQRILITCLIMFFSMNFIANASETNVQNETTNIDQTDPYSMINEVANLTFKRLAKEHAAIKKDPNILKDVVREELIPYVDYRYASLKVIGKHLRKQKREDVNAFVEVFREYLITSYAQIFTLYDQQKVNFEPSKKLGQERTVSVDVKVMQPGGDDLKISFQVRKGKNKTKWKAFNMIAEGISLLDSKRAELASIISQKGLPYATELLKEKSERDIYFK